MRPIVIYGVLVVFDSITFKFVINNLFEEFTILNFVIKSKVVLSHFKYVCFMLLDRVFGPTTTTRHVYDIAAQHVVSGAMEGVNGKLY